jgi:ELWxxDGT repeat protein
MIRAMFLVGLACVAIGAAPHSVVAGTPQLVRNVDSAIVPQAGYGGILGTLGGKVLFSGSDATGPGLWSTDGTAAGSVLIKRFDGYGVFIASAAQPNFVRIGGRAYFPADDGVTGIELWSTDGTTAGTTLVKDIYTGDGSFPQLKGALGNKLIFTARANDEINQIYVTDGSAAGTVRISNVSSNLGTVRDEIFVAANKFYFVAVDTGGNDIWVSDGTTAGTHRVINSLGSNNSSVARSAVDNPNSFRALGNQIVYLSSSLLWTIDTGTDTLSAITVPSGTPGFGPPRVQEAAGLIAMDGFVLFAVEGGLTNHFDWWRTDGTIPGTYALTAVTSGNATLSSQPYPLVRKVGDRVIYLADDGSGQQFWSTDGTAASPIRLTSATGPINIGPPITRFVATVGDAAYFSLPDGGGGTTWSVWSTDGTLAGTHKVSGLPTIDQSMVTLVRVAGDSGMTFLSVPTTFPLFTLFRYEPSANRLTALKEDAYDLNEGYLFDGQQLFYGYDDATLGNELWVSDGTVTGTHITKDLNPQTADYGSTPDEFVEFDGRLAFAATDGVHGRELWSSDGTLAGTTLLADVNPGADGSNPSHLFAASGSLFFFAQDTNFAMHFMRLASGSTAAEPLAALTPQPVGQAPGYVVDCIQDTPVTMGGKVYFAATDFLTGLELWSSDGTASGTRLVADINPGFADSNPCYLTVLGNRVYFSAAGPDGIELWSSDGTGSGTTKVADLSAVIGDPYPGKLMVFDGVLYFDKRDNTHGLELWKTDGSTAGTTMVADIVPGTQSSVAVPVGTLGGKLLLETIATNNSVPEYQLWLSAGTATGTTRLGTVVIDVGAGVFLNGDHAYFGVRDSAGQEPWVSDGTDTGTHMLKDVNPTGDSMPHAFRNFNGVTLFEVTDPVRGAQLWRTDGTTAGTVVVSDIPGPPDPAYANQNHRRLVVGQNYFFAANDPAIGTELYALANDSPVAGADTASSTDGRALTIPVLANDSDGDGTLNTSSVHMTSAPGHGAVVAGANGELVYTPTSGFSGTDSFTYTVGDNQGATSNTATVTVTVILPTVPVVSSGGKGGGGATTLLELFGLLTACLWRLNGGSCRSWRAPRLCPHSRLRL